MWFFIIRKTDIKRVQMYKTDVSGMVTLAPSGKGYSLKNTGYEMLAFIALIVTE